MYNQPNYNGIGCGCNKVAPIVAPKRVCVCNTNQYVEQPVICPVEYRRVNNLVYYPRYYPVYEQTVVNQGAAQMQQQYQATQTTMGQNQFTQNQVQNTEIDIDINQNQFRR